MTTQAKLHGLVDDSWKARLAVMDAECALVGIEPAELRRHILQRVTGIILQTGGSKALEDLLPEGMDDHGDDPLEEQVRRGDEANRSLLVDGYLLALVEDVVERNLIQALTARIDPAKHQFDQVAAPLSEIARAVIEDEEHPIPAVEAAVLILAPLLGYGHGGSLTLPDRTYRFADGRETRNLDIIGGPDERRSTVGAPQIQ